MKGAKISAFDRDDIRPSSRSILSLSFDNLSNETGIVVFECKTLRINTVYSDFNGITENSWVRQLGVTGIK